VSNSCKQRYRLMSRHLSQSSGHSTWEMRKVLYNEVLTAVTAPCLASYYGNHPVEAFTCLFTGPRRRRNSVGWATKHWNVNCPHNESWSTEKNLTWRPLWTNIRTRFQYTMPSMWQRWRIMRLILKSYLTWFKFSAFYFGDYCHAPKLF